MRSELKRLFAVKIISYALLITLALALQSALPPVWYVRPQLLIVAAAMAAMFHGPYAGGTAGFFCGLLVDWLSVYSVAYYTITLMLLGIIWGIAVEYGVRRTLLSGYFVAVISLTVVQLLHFAFFLWMPGRAGWRVLIDITTPEIIYSLVLLPLFYFPARTVYRRTRRKG